MVSNEDMVLIGIVVLLVTGLTGIAYKITLNAHVILLSVIGLCFCCFVFRPVSKEGGQE